VPQCPLCEVFHEGPPGHSTPDRVVDERACVCQLFGCIDTVGYTVADCIIF
jgi:hypothetical protein